MSDQEKVESLKRELEAATHEIQMLRLRLEASRNFTRRALGLARALSGCCQEQECFLDGTQRAGDSRAIGNKER